MNADELDLLDGWLGGEISDADFFRLQSLLRGSAEARAVLRSLATVETKLQELAAGRRETAELFAPHPLVRERAPRRWWRPALGIAALFAILAALAWIYFFQRTPMSAVVATLSQSSGAALLAGGAETGVEDGAALREGAYELHAGFLEVTYASGAVVLIESPAKFELRGTTVITLREGNLSARVPEAAIGFTVETPTASVVDLGTEFGVSANATSSEVHVFTGEVLVKTPGEPDPLHLKENHASRIDLATRTPRGIEFQPQKFLRSLDDPTGKFAKQLVALEPLAYYRMKTKHDANKLIDQTRLHHGLVIPGRSSSPWTTGRPGPALRLGGSEMGTFAVVPDFPKAAGGALTVCAWVHADSRPRWASIAKNWVQDERGKSSGQFHFGLWHDDGDLEVLVHDARGKVIGARENAPLPLGEWQFVAFTLDGAMLRLYRDGNEVAATPCAGLSTAGPAALGIGVRLDATGTQPERKTPGFWDGRIDELAVFHHALSAAQIAQLFHAKP